MASSATQNSLTLTRLENRRDRRAQHHQRYQPGHCLGLDPQYDPQSLQADYNDVLMQIDALAQNASYNGINLLNGDDLKVVFNETGSRALTIAA